MSAPPKPSNFIFVIYKPASPKKLLKKSISDLFPKNEIMLKSKLFASLFKVAQGRIYPSAGIIVIKRRAILSFVPHIVYAILLIDL